MSAIEPRNPPSATAKKYAVYFCSHTHWDREWYGSFQQFRYRLVRLIDRLMDLLDRDPEYRCFNLDGQTIVLEDYLEIRPDQRARLERFIREGRIMIGPWYILPDEWLVSGESTVRNWLRGRAICREFGVEPPKVGYLPDMFGHLSQIPQILRGLGIDNAIFWRGLSGDEWMTELWWEASDGSRVLSVHLPEYCGYCNAGLFYASLPSEAKTLPADTNGGWMISEDKDFAVNALRKIADRAIARSRSGVLFLMNGVDHMEPVAEVPEILKLAGEKYPDLEFRHATYSEFIDAVIAASPKDLQVVRGEHRNTAWAKDSGGLIIQNILSSRIHLKLSNMTCQTLLEKWVEPFASAAAAIGIPYPQAHIRDAWKSLLKNHPHDSIGGCSIDEVHFQMEARFSEVEDISTLLTNASLHGIADSIDTSALADDEFAYFLFNPLNWQVSDLMRVTIQVEEEWLKARGITLYPDNIYRSIRNLRILEWDGTPVEFSVEKIEHLFVHRPWITSFCPLQSVVQFTVWLAARNLPALGYKAYRIGPVAKSLRTNNRHGSTNPAVLENEYIRAEFQSDGTVALSGLAVGPQPMHGLHYFEDGGDNGDGYTYSMPRHDGVVTSRCGRVQITRLADEIAVKAVAVDYTLELPESVTPDRQSRSTVTVPFKIRSVFRLGPDSKRLDVETTLTNHVKDHRLRVCFDVGGNAGSHVAEMPYDVVERPNRVPQPPEDIWIEDEPLEAPQNSFISVGHLAIANFGLPEYESVLGHDETVMKLTLLRAVNYLGAGGHANTIIGGAGPHLETPQQQLIGRAYTFRYALIPHTGDWESAGVQRQAHQHNALWRGVAGSRNSGFLPAAKLSFFEATGDNIVLSAIKRCDDEADCYIVRVWNSGSKPSNANLLWFRKPAAAWLSNLAEESFESLSIAANGSAAVTIKPKQIFTVKFQLAQSSEH